MAASESRQSVVVQRVQQLREFAADHFVPLSQLLVEPAASVVILLQHLVLGMGRVVCASIAGPVVLTDLALMLRDHALVRGEGLLMLQQVRLVLVKLGLDAAQQGEQIAVLDAPGAMVSHPAFVIRAAVFVVALVIPVFVAHAVLLVGSWCPVQAFRPQSS